METVLIVLGSFAAYVVAYRTYGRYISRRIFRIEPERVPPSVEVNDGVDYVPSHRDMVFGHHFTSIAGTGPIVGPAIAVVWGWVPALIWVLVGSIFMGAVHDFGALIVSMRHRGKTIADLARDVVNPRVRILFMLVVMIGLWIVLAVFGLVIATIFKLYPSSVMPTILQIPIAVGLGIWFRRGGGLIPGTVVAVGLMYASVAAAASVAALQWSIPETVTQYISANAVWTILLLGYVFVASVLPVQYLLQPRDYINAHQLLIAMGLLVAGVIFAHPPIVADALNAHPASPPGKPPAPAFIPFLFVTIACGAISGFHCLVSSGCSSRQLRTEADAQYVGFGAMLTEGFLAVLVIVACCAGIGMGTTSASGAALTGAAAWQHHYATWGGDGGLPLVLAPFVTGSANMIESLGVSHALATAIMGVFVASFAATTLDSATRLQRYVISEFVAPGGTGGGTGRRPVSSSSSLRTFFSGRFGATSIAVVTAGALALSDAWSAGLANAGRGGMTLWPVFGATNQLLGGLALLVVTIWLVRNARPIWVTCIPMVFMVVMTGWALGLLLIRFYEAGWSKWHLFVVTSLMLVMEAWIVIEGVALILSGAARRRSLSAE